MAAAAFLAKLRADLLRASMTDSPEGKRNEMSPGGQTPIRKPIAAARRRRSSHPPFADPRNLPEADDSATAVPMGGLALATQCRSSQHALPQTKHGATIVL
jgi:hypothetical protein